MSSEKRPKQDVPQGASDREGGASIRREDDGSIEFDRGRATCSRAGSRRRSRPCNPSRLQSHDASERRSQPPLPPSMPALGGAAPALRGGASVTLPPLPDEGVASPEAEIAPLTFGNDMSSLAPTVREQPARAPERRGSLRPLLVGLLAFAAAGALWIGLPHPEVSQMLAPHAATAGVVDHEPGATAVERNSRKRLERGKRECSECEPATRTRNGSDRRIAVAPVNDVAAAAEQSKQRPPTRSWCRR